MNSEHKLIYHKSAVKFFNKQNKSSPERITAALEGLLMDPPKGDIKTLQGFTGLYRLRIGSYRVVFDIDYEEKIIYIQAIGNRRDIYKQ